jgi:hypothetical protein
MNPVIPILLTVFLCFFLLLVTCVLCIFATAIRLLWQAAPILANLRSPDRRTTAWRVMTQMPTAITCRRTICQIDSVPAQFKTPWPFGLGVFVREPNCCPTLWDRPVKRACQVQTVFPPVPPGRPPT